MGCRIFRKRTDFTTTSTALTEKMIVIFVSTLGKGRKYRRASDRWETGYLFRGGRALAVGTWYVEVDFSFCGITYFNPFIVVLFLGSRVLLGTVSWYQKRSEWESKQRIDARAELITKCAKAGRAFHRLAVRLSGQKDVVSVLHRQANFVLQICLLVFRFCTQKHKTPSEHQGQGEVIVRGAAVHQDKVLRLLTVRGAAWQDFSGTGGCSFGLLITYP